MAGNRAAALRLEIEEIQEHVILESPRKVALQSPFVCYCQRNGIKVMVPIFIAFIMLMTACNVVTANQEHQRQRAARQLRMLAAEKQHNMLTIDRLATQPRMLQMATDLGLEQPTTERIHIIKSASSNPGRHIANSNHRGNSVGSKVASLYQRIWHGPGVAAAIE